MYAIGCVVQLGQGVVNRGEVLYRVVPRCLELRNEFIDFTNREWIGIGRGEVRQQPDAWLARGGVQGGLHRVVVGGGAFVDWLFDGMVAGGHNINLLGWGLVWTLCRGSKFRVLVHRPVDVCSYYGALLLPCSGGG